MAELAFHHFGLAVREPEGAATFLSGLGYRLGEALFDPNQNVHLILGTHETQPAVEIIYPGADEGPIDKWVQRYASGIIYHLCYSTQNLEEILAQWEARGLQAVCVSSPKPALLFGGRRVSFYNVVGMGLVEILE
jgi:hypothetical protein